MSKAKVVMRLAELEQISLRESNLNFLPLPDSAPWGTSLPSGC